MNSWPIFSSSVIASIVASTQAMSSSLRWNGWADRSTTMLSSSTRVQVEIIVHHAAMATSCHKLLSTRPPHPAAPVPGASEAIHGNRLLPFRVGIILLSPAQPRRILTHAEVDHDSDDADPDTEERRTQKELGIRSVIGYGAGDLANNLAFTLSTTFLLLYYTDVVGLPAAAIGTMFLVVRLWDAFADLFAGRMIDRTMTRWGKFRPFILFGSIPLLVMSVLTFAVPAGWDGGAQLLYAYLTYAVLGLIYSMVNVPYGSLATAMTQVSRERAKLAVARGLGAGLGGLLLTFIIAPQIQDIAKNKALSADERAAHCSRCS